MRIWTAAPIQDPGFESEAKIDLEGQLEGGRPSWSWYSKKKYSKIFWKDNLEEGGRSDPDPTSWCNWSPLTCGGSVDKLTSNSPWYRLFLDLEPHSTICLYFSGPSASNHHHLGEAIFCTGIQALWWISSLQVHHMDVTGYINCLFASFLQSVPFDVLQFVSLLGLEYTIYL